MSVSDEIETRERDSIEILEGVQVRPTPVRGWGQAVGFRLPASRRTTCPTTLGYSGEAPNL